MIEESNRNETKNQARTSPEPDVLMKHVEYYDSKNKQEFSHGGENLARPFVTCQALTGSVVFLAQSLRLCGLVVWQIKFYRRGAENAETAQRDSAAR